MKFIVLAFWFQTIFRIGLFIEQIKIKLFRVETQRSKMKQRIKNELTAMQFWFHFSTSILLNCTLIFFFFIGEYGDQGGSP